MATHRWRLAVDSNSTVYTAKMAFPNVFSMKRGDKVCLVHGISAVVLAPKGSKPSGTFLSVEYVTLDGHVTAEEWAANTPVKEGTTPMVNFEEEKKDD